MKLWRTFITLQKLYWQTLTYNKIMLNTKKGTVNLKKMSQISVCIELLIDNRAK